MMKAIIRSVLKFVLKIVVADLYQQIIDWIMNLN